MKKKLSLLTGIVILVTILVTCGSRNINNQEDPNQVKIYLKAVELNGEMHLLIRDSNNPNDTVIDNLITDVRPGIIVKWKKDNPQSGIRNINQVRPVKMPEKNKGLIFNERPKSELVNDSILWEIPQDANPGTEKYVIIFTDTVGDIWCIDPYLRIR